MTFINPFSDWFRDWFTRDVYNEKINQFNTQNNTNYRELENKQEIPFITPLFNKTADISKNIMVIAVVVGGIYIYNQLKVK
jgi:hypothetical protein